MFFKPTIANDGTIVSQILCSTSGPQERPETTEDKMMAVKPDTKALKEEYHALEATLHHLLKQYEYALDKAALDKLAKSLIC